MPQRPGAAPAAYGTLGRVSFDARVLPSPAGMHRVVLHGALETIPARNLAEVLTSCGTAAEPLVLDAQDLTSIGLAGLRALAHEAARRARRGGAVHVLRVPAALLPLFAGAGLLPLTRIDLAAPTLPISA
jgi:anti-anti-sigma regulatory factor